MDPIHQFEIKNLLPIAHIGGIEIAVTNSALFMLIGLATILLLMLGATRSPAPLPGRLRPVSHSVRLFANMLAGHITLKVFGGFVVMIGGFGFLGWLGAALPLALTTVLTALELLVAVLQAYVFAILTCIYLNDAIHPGH